MEAIVSGKGKAQTLTVLENQQQRANSITRYVLILVNALNFTIMFLLNSLKRYWKG